MAGLVEGFARTIGWSICPNNVIVEGTSDVALCWVTAALYFERHQVALLGEEVAILAAGKGNEGGVDGLNRRLHAARQIADADRGPDGSLRHRFIGLYDNDRAGRRAIDVACNFDRRLLKFGDLFLLHPIMPLAAGADHIELRRRFESSNAAFSKLDCEIEDLLSERLLLQFEAAHPDAVREILECAGRKHWEFTRDGKAQLHQFLTEHAKLEDVVDVVRLIRALRDYLRLPTDNIVC